MKTDLRRRLRILLESQGGSFTAYHGSQRKINDTEGFLTKYILSGEGNNIFGWGLYFTDIVDIAVTYARNNASNEGNRLLSLASEFDVTSVGEMEDFFTMQGAWDDISPEVQSLISDPKNANKGLMDLIDKGYLYQVTITPSKPKNFPWYEEIPESGNKLGSDYYAELKHKLGSEKDASLYLYKQGYYGITYPTGTLSDSDNYNTGTNYVVFNDKDINITKVTRL